MIIVKCDFCRGQQGNINSIVLYKQKIDYCGNCAKKVYELKKEFQKEVETLNRHFDSTLRTKEKLIIESYKK